MAHVGDYQIRWKNYKAFQDTGWLTIKPLTILIGANSSGKTSITAPLLLMSQTMSSRAQIPLVTKGPLIDAGAFRDFIHNHRTNQSLYFGFRYHIHTPTKNLKDIGAYPPGTVELCLKAGDRPEDIILSEIELSDLYGRPFFKQTRNMDGTYSPARKGLFKTTQSERMKAREIAAVRSAKPASFMFSPAAVLASYQRNSLKKEKFSIAQFSENFRAYLTALSVSFEDLRGYFRDLSYIGPLRDRPRRYYEKTSEIPPTVGPRGQHMANIIRRMAKEPKNELSKWIRDFEFGQRVRVHDISSELFSLFFTGKSSQAEINIAGAGFGASQVLPLVVQALTAKEFSLTIAEQPEIHLNPRLQSHLADLFVGMAVSKRRVIVETHSEHLLLRLRRLISEKTIPAEMVALYFVEKIDGVSTVRRISIDDDGRIPSREWPNGFFEDGLRESLALAVSQSESGRSTKKKAGGVQHK